MRDVITKMLTKKWRRLGVPVLLEAEGKVEGQTVQVRLQRLVFWRVSWGVPGVAKSWRYFRLLYVGEALGLFHLLVRQHNLEIKEESWVE